MRRADGGTELGAARTRRSPGYVVGTIATPAGRRWGSVAATFAASVAAGATIYGIQLIATSLGGCAVDDGIAATEAPATPGHFAAVGAAATGNPAADGADAATLTEGEVHTVRPRREEARSPELPVRAAVLGLSIDHRLAPLPRDAQVEVLEDVRVLIGEDPQVLWLDYSVSGAAANAAASTGLRAEARDVPAEFAGGRLLPVVDLNAMGGPEIAFAVPAVGKAFFGDETEDDDVLRLERAPGSAQLSDGQAFARTVALRFLQACPTSRSPCLLYGPKDDVLNARDPVEPTGGWFGLRSDVDAEPHANVPYVVAERYPLDDGVWLEVEAPATDLDDLTERLLAQADDDARPSPPIVHRAFLRLPNQVRQHAFNFRLYGHVSDGAITVGLIRQAGRLAVWLWDPDDVSISLSEHDRRDGRRLEAPIHFRGVPYQEPECGVMLSSTRPTPVRAAGGWAFALAFGDDRALLFEEGESVMVAGEELGVPGRWIDVGRGVGPATRGIDSRRAQAGEANDDGWAHDDFEGGDEALAADLPALYVLQGGRLTPTG